MEQNITKRCAKCGITLGAENISCPICGGKLDIVGQGQQSPAQPMQPTSFGQPNMPPTGQQPYMQPTGQMPPTGQQPYMQHTGYGQPQRQYGQPQQFSQTQYGQPGQVLPTGYIHSISFQPPAQQPAPVPPKKSNKGLVIGIVVGLAVTAAAVAGVLLAINGVFSGGKEVPAETGETSYTDPTDKTDGGYDTTTAAPVTTKAPGVVDVSLSTTAATENIYTTAETTAAPEKKRFYTEDNDYAVDIGNVTLFPREVYFRDDGSLVAVCVCSNGFEKNVTISAVKNLTLIDGKGKVFAQGDFDGMELELDARSNDCCTFEFDGTTGSVVGKDPDLSGVTIDCNCEYEDDESDEAYYYSEKDKDTITAGKLGFSVKEAYYDDDGDLCFTLYCSNGKDNAVFVKGFDYLRIKEVGGDVIAEAGYGGICFPIAPGCVTEQEFTISKSNSETFRAVSGFTELEAEYSVNFTNMGTDPICISLLEQGYNDNYDIVLKCCVYNNLGKDTTLYYMDKFEVYDADGNLVATTKFMDLNKKIAKNSSIIYTFVVPSSDVTDYYADLSTVSVTYSYNYQD